MNSKSHQLALRKQLLLLKLQSHRMEIDIDMAALRNPMRNAAIGGGVFQLLRAHPIFISAASALLTRIPKLGLIVKLAGAALGGWQFYKMLRAWRDTE
jgi:threonine/homoserine/homoserine lactone efflux protein